MSRETEAVAIFSIEGFFNELDQPAVASMHFLPVRKVMQEVENQYEHRLAVELDRYDRLSEEVESVQQRCESLLESQQKEQDWELRARDQVRKGSPSDVASFTALLSESRTGVCLTSCFSGVASVKTALLM